MASITFNDGVARTLQNSITVPAGNQFRGWLAKPIKVGAIRHGLGTGIRYIWEHRTDYKVSFSIEELKPSECEVAQYLLLHLQGENKTCTLNTADIAARTYTAFLGEGDEATLSGPDDQYHYTFTATLTISAPGTPPLCVYHA